jgi:amino acid transporter
MGSSGSKPRTGRPSGGRTTTTRQEEALHLPEGHQTMWGWFAGIIVLALIAVPLSAAFSFATNPRTQQLFAGRLSEATAGGYQAFWWVVTLLLIGLPILVGYGVAKLSARALAIVGGVVALFVIAILVLGQMFVF